MKVLKWLPEDVWNAWNFGSQVTVIFTTYTYGLTIKLIFNLSGVVCRSYISIFVKYINENIRKKKHSSKNIQCYWLRRCLCLDVETETIFHRAQPQDVIL